MLPEPEISVPEPEIPEEQELDISASGKGKKKNRGSIVRAREPSTRIRKPRVKAVRTDPDHPTDEQARNSPEAVEWTKARGKERD